MPFFSPLVLDDQIIHFSHLDPFTLTVESRIANKMLRVGVRFSNHCFTKAYDPVTHPKGLQILLDAGRRERTFCGVRYRLSLQLPNVLANFGHPRAQVWQTAEKRNWAYSMTIEEPQGPYHVFFELKRSPPSHRPQWDLNMVVESAYHESPHLGPPKVMGKMGFVLLCGKVYTGKPVSTKR